MGDMDLNLLNRKWLMNSSVCNFKSLRRCGLQEVLRISLLKNPAFLVKVKSFHLLTSSLFSFHVHKLPGRVALQFSQPVLWMEVTSQQQPVPPPALSHEGHLQFCICVVIYECFCFGPVLSLSQKVSSLPVAMTASLSSVYDKVSQWYALRMKFGFWKAKSIYALMHTPRLWEHCYEITHKN